jgi:ribosomal protein S18 acetylase RimI-like enzyme
VAELSVDPEYRRQGVASALMRAVEDWVRNQPDLPRTISLGVETDNKDAVALYSKLGYAAAKRDGEAVTFMGSDGKPCYVYYKILNQDSV